MFNDNAIGIVFIAAPGLLTIRVRTAELGSFVDDKLAGLGAALDAAEQLPPVREVVVDLSNVGHFGARLTGIIAERSARWREHGCRLSIRGDRRGIFAACGLDGLTAFPPSCSTGTRAESESPARHRHSSKRDLVAQG